MNIQEYIASGILELYVAGLLSKEENLEIHRIAGEHSEIQDEIERIENAIMALAKAGKPKGHVPEFETVKTRIIREGQDNLRQLYPNRSKRKLTQYTGWVAAAVLAGWMLYLQNHYNQLESQLNREKDTIIELEQQITESRNSANDYKALLDRIRSKNVQVIALNGQGSFTETYAKAYLDKNTNEVLIDASGLPEPPEGKVYQVWSLKLSPLTPTSIGLLADFQSDENKIFALDALEGSEAFGITLEPAGGSQTPTMEQLYTLGALTS